MGQLLNKSKKDDNQNEGKLTLDELIDKKYDELLKNVNDETDFHHAIYKLIEEMAKQKGAMQFTLPSRDVLEAAFKEYHRDSSRELSQEEFKNIMKKVLTFDSFYIGQGALDVILLLFGAPISALLLKRFIPGLSSMSDDIVIPTATSGAVVFLAKTHKL